MNEKDFFSPLLRLKSDNAAGDTASKNARRLMVAQPPRCYRTKGCWCDKIHSTKFRENRKEKWDQWSLLRQAETMHHNTQKNNSDKGVQERLQAHSRSGRLQDERERERETEGGREPRGCLWTIREPRGCRFFATARFSPNSGHSDICLLRISSSPDRQFVDVEFSFHIWIQDLSSISGFRSCSWFLNSRSVPDTWILDLSLIPGVQDLLLTPGFGTLFKLWVVVFGMSILGYHPGFFNNFFKILFWSYKPA